MAFACSLRLNGFQQAKYLTLCNIMTVSTGDVVELLDNEFTATNQNAANHAVEEFLHNINILQEHNLADTANKLKEFFSWHKQCISLNFFSRDAN